MEKPWRARAAQGDPDPAPSAATESQPAPCSGDQRASVLVIDDQAVTCKVVSVVLSDSYQVTGLTSPLSALEALLRHDYDAVLCDVMMPELNGVELFERVLRERPSLAQRFVFITGGVSNDGARVLLEQTARPVLRKPCPTRELHAAIADVIARAI